MNNSSLTPQQRSALDALYAAMWSHREALNCMVFYLYAMGWVIAEGRTGIISTASGLLEKAATRNNCGEKLRLSTSSEAAMCLGLPPDATLGDLARVAPDADALILNEHLLEYQAVAGEIEEATAHLKHAAASTSEVCDALLNDTHGATSNSQVAVDRRI